MDSIQPNIVNRQVEAEDYLKKHKINELFVNITSHLVYSKPGRVYLFNLCLKAGL